MEFEDQKFQSFTFMDGSFEEMDHFPQSSLEPFEATFQNQFAPEINHNEQVLAYDPEEPCQDILDCPMENVFQYNSLFKQAPKTTYQNKLDIFARSKLKLSISGELFSSVRCESIKEETRIQVETLKPDQEEFKQQRSEEFLTTNMNRLQSTRGSSFHSSKMSSALSAHSNGSSKSRRKDLIMKGILRKMRKELKDQFLALTDYQNQKRYREDLYYLTCLTLFRDSIQDNLRTNLTTQQLKIDQDQDIQEFLKELLIFLAYLFYPKDVKKSYKFDSSMADVASKCQPKIFDRFTQQNLRKILGQSLPFRVLLKNFLDENKSQILKVHTNDSQEFQSYSQTIDHFYELIM